MEINVAQLMKQPIGATRTFEVGEIVEGLGEAGEASEVRGDVKMMRIKDGILVRAKLNTDVGCTCSRCLETARCNLKLEIEEEYLPTVDVNTGHALDVPEEAHGFTIDSNHILSLDEAIRQYVLLDQPMQPLCKPDCAGLCPECGANLNLEQCDCHLRRETGPFEALQELLDTGDDSLANNERS